jgi:hypothetical protein
MKDDRRRIIYAFAFGVFCFEIVCLTLVWVKFTPVNQSYNAAILSVVLAAGFLILVLHVRRMYANYRLDESASPYANTNPSSSGTQAMSGAEYLRRVQNMQSKTQTVSCTGSL